jgi:hypothetical protein
MHAVAERDVLVGLAAHIESEWLVEDFVVAVAGNVRQQ